MVPFLEIVVASASVFTIMAVTIERYLLLYHPNNWRKIKTGQVMKILLLIWTFSIGIGSPILFIVRYKDSSFIDGTPVKVCRLPIQKDWQKFYIVLMTLVIYVLPCMILFLLYSRVCWILNPFYESKSDIHDVTHREKKRVRRQVVNIIATIVIVFFLCHLPYRVVSLWLVFENKRVLENLGLEKYLNILYSARILLYINHALNPILYNFVSKRFRATLIFLFYEKCATRNHDEFRTANRNHNAPASTKQSKKNVVFRRPTPPQNVCSCNDNHRSLSSSSSVHRINNFTFIYTKLNQNQIQHEHELEDSAIKHERRRGETFNNRVVSLHLKAINGCYITMEVAKNLNSDMIHQHTT